MLAMRTPQTADARWFCGAEVEDELEWAQYDYQNMKDQMEKTTLNEKVSAPPLVLERGHMQWGEGGRGRRRKGGGRGATRCERMALP
jgi:hypothetical protein